MGKFSITRTIEIDAAHRVPDHRSKCCNLHGHRYRIDATVEGPTFKEGEQKGMVMDFGFLKWCMMETIHKNCDHGSIFSVDDPMLIGLLGSVARQFTYGEAVIFPDLPGWKFCIVEEVPTAENLAMIWYRQLQQAIGEFFKQYNPAITPPELLCVDVWETPSCVARYPS